jgi:hypothetical protein
MKLIRLARDIYRGSNPQLYGSRELTYDHAATFMALAVEHELASLSARVAKLEAALASKDAAA